MSGNAREPTDAELQELLSRLELSEKIGLLAGRNTWETFPVERLNIPSLKVSDGPNGARGAEFLDGTTAACFPACVSIAASFNPDLAERIGRALGQEAQTKGAYVLLGPTVCPHRSPLGGRNFEAFSEDPLVAGVLASACVRGMQAERVAATVKHYVANEQDTRRFSVNETISQRALREIYLRPFEIVVKEADPWCIMTSYPKVNGFNIDASSKFIQDILRGEWGYQGLVMSDWGATSNHVESVKYGLDLEMPGPPRHRTLDNVQAAVEKGLVSEADIDARALAVLKLLRRTGKFTDRREPALEKAINLPEHQKLIREAGAEGIVLLQNKDSTLPIDAKAVKKIAVVGPLAKYVAAHGGGSASLNCHYKVNPFDALKERLGSEVEVTYSKGTHIFRVYPDLQEGTANRNGNPGFIVDYFKTPDLSDAALHTEEYPRGMFMSLMNEKAQGSKAARLTTTFTPSKAGKHYLSMSGLGPARMFIDGVLVADQPKDTNDCMGFLVGVQDEVHFQHEFEAGKGYEIVVETYPVKDNNSELHLIDDQIAVHLGFVEQAEMEADLLSEAVALAKDADVALCFVGNTTQWETEGIDMASMTLPANGSQDKLVAAVAAANPRTVVVVSTGVPVELPWLADVGAVLQSWYAGQEVGNAMVDVLLGEAAPGGKLPVSWPRKYEHTACYGNFGLDSYESRQVEYVEGVYVGYRHFDRTWGSEKEVLFPFGYGLSYTTFDVRDASVSGSIEGADGKVTVSVSVTNTGSRAGAETVQVYLAPPAGGAVDRPTKALVGFAKVSLQPGETKEAEVTFKRDAAAFWDETASSWKVEAGKHEVLVATSSGTTDVKAKLQLDIPQTMYRV